VSGIVTKPDRAAARQSARPVPRLENGDHLDQKTFHARYEAMPKGVKAELIGGRVYIVASPVLVPHGRPHGRLVGWLAIYHAATPGTDVFDNTSTVLGDDSEPQPDACLLIAPQCGGQTREEDRWIRGTPELIVEVASSSESYDLHEKRKDYERYGVREYVVFVARQERVYWWVGRGERYEELPAGADGVFRSETFPGLWLDAAALVQSDAGKMYEVLRQGLATPEHAAFVAKLEAARKSP
jgi:Uma2 family endonuclease